MSIELELVLFAVICFVCAIGILFWGFGTANEFEEGKRAKDELDRRKADAEEGEE